MSRWNSVVGLLSVAVLAIAAGSAGAFRTPMTRTPGMRMHGTRPDITVPYTTNGRSAFGVAQGVSPRITIDPNVDDRKNPQSRPTYNLPFYGGVNAAGDKTRGAIPRPAR
jgi:hypothetical protein